MPEKITPTAISSPVNTRLVVKPMTLLLMTMAAAWLLSASAAYSQDSAVATVTQAFYADRAYRPVWLEPRRLLELQQLSQLAELHGLNPDDYRLAELGSEANALLHTERHAELARLDFLLTQSVLRLARHLRYGKVDPSGLQPKLGSSPDSATLAALLRDAAAAESLLTWLDNLSPDTLLYKRLQLSLARHRELLAEHRVWPTIQHGRVVEPGMRDPRLSALRQRLGLAAATHDQPVYDAELAAAVAAFQARHGLQADGILGPRTITALNVPLQQRIEQLRVNLEWQRWAAMPADSAYLRVNIPLYTLHWIENGNRTLSMRTQVGRSSRQTPAFRSSVNAIMANPSWTVPPTIFREDILPKLQSDASFLQAQGMYVVDNRGRTVASHNINWQQINADEFPHRLRRRPGGDNALGRMKFLVPNPYLIYLHDTPARHLFARPARATSSGCIRVEDPDLLAGLLADAQENRINARLERAKQTDRQRFIGLQTPVPLVVMYATIDLDEDGELIFAADIYGRDEKMLAVLDSIPPRATKLLMAALSPDERG